MTKPYLVFVDGKLAGRKVTLIGAKKLMKELLDRGYKMVSLAEEV